MLLSLKMEEGAVSRGVRAPGEAGEGRMDSAPEPPDRTASCSHLDFQAVRPFLKFRPVAPEDKFVLLKLLRL